MAGAKYTVWFDETPEGERILKEEMREVLAQWARNGLTQDEIAKNMGLSRSTLREWCKKYPSISDALKNARAYADARVENALFMKAVGYTKLLKKPIKVRRAHIENGRKVGEEEVVEYVDEEVHVQPDVAAIAFYLKNRLPQVWKDRRLEIPEEEEDETGDVCVRLMKEAQARAREAKAKAEAEAKAEKESRKENGKDARNVRK